MRYLVVVAFVFSAACAPTSSQPTNEQVGTEKEKTTTTPQSFGNGKVVVRKGNTVIVHSLSDNRQVYSRVLNESLAFVALSKDGSTLTFKEAYGNCESVRLSDQTSTLCNAATATNINFVIGAGVTAGLTHHIHDQGEMAPLAFSSRASDGTLTKFGEWDAQTNGLAQGGVVSRDGSRVVVTTVAPDLTTGTYVSFAPAAGFAAPQTIVDLGATKTFVSTCSHIDLSSNGNRFAYCDADPTSPFLSNIRTVMLDIPSGQSISIAGATRFALSPDGESIAWAEGDGNLKLNRFTSPTAVLEITDRVRSGGQIAFTTDGKRLLVDIENRGLVSYDANTLGDARVMFPKSDDDPVTLYTDLFAGHRDITSD